MSDLRFSAILSLVITFSLTSQAEQKFEIEISNENSFQSISLGEYRGTKIPSACDRGSGVQFCWNEVRVKFKPYSKNLTDIKGSNPVSFTLDQFNEKGPFVEVSVRGHVDRSIQLVPCQIVPPDQTIHIVRADIEIRQSDIHPAKQIVCLSSPRTRILFGR